MSGLGGLNKSADGMVVGLVQYQLPVVETPEDVARTAREICETVVSVKKGMPTLDL